MEEKLHKNETSLTISDKIFNYLKESILKIKLNQIKGLMKKR